MEKVDEIPAVSDEVMQIYTWVSLSVVCQIINLFGIVTNILNIICFVKQGFEDSVNVSLLGLAVSDLGSLTTMVWTCISYTPAVVAADLLFDPMEINYLTSAMPHFTFTRVSACITAMITLERCLCITAPLKIKSLITPKRTAVFTVSIFVIFISSGFPVYAVNRFGMKFSALRNKTLYGLISLENRQYVESISFTVNNFIIPLCAFTIIVVCTAMITFKLKKAIQWREKTSSQVDKVSGRQQKAAKMVVTISSLFIICFIPVTIIMLAMGLVPSLSVNGKHMYISVLIGGFGYEMESINSSMNIFIYYRMSSKYKQTFRNTFSVFIRNGYVCCGCNRSQLEKM